MYVIIQAYRVNDVLRVEHLNLMNQSAATVNRIWSVAADSFIGFLTVQHVKRQDYDG